MFQDNKDTKKIFRGGEEKDYDVSAILQELKNIGSTQNYVNNLSATVANFERMASAARTLFGGTEMFSTVLKNTFAGARASVVALGGSMEDIENIQMGIFENLNTQTILNKEEFAKLYSAANLVSKTGANLGVEAGNIAGKFVNAGIQLNNVGDTMKDILNKAREIGVSTVATYSILAQNLEVANTFSFKNGIQGMSEMAANAALMRVDMGKTLATAEKFLDPENAIEAAARFQNLGVNIAELLDPRKLEYMSLFEPDKLREKIGEAMKQYASKDEMGNTIISPTGLMLMREFSKIVSFTKEDLTNMGKTSFDMSNKLAEMRFNPNLFGDEKTQKLIAGMATMATSGEFKGEYVVKVGEKGKEIDKPIARLSDSDVEFFRKATEAKETTKLQEQANGDFKNMTNFLRSIDGTLTNYLATQKDVQKNMLDGIKTTRDFAEKLGKMVGVTRTETGQITMEPLYKKLDQLIESNIKQSGGIKDFENFQKMIETNFKSIIGPFFEGFKKILPTGNTLNFNEIITQSTSVLNQIQQGITGQTTPINVQTPTTTTPQQPISPTTNTTYTPADINSKTSIEQKSESVSKVEFGGTVNINVTPTEFKQSLMHALDSADVQSKIASAIKVKTTQENTYSGSGDVSKLPKTNFS